MVEGKSIFPHHFIALLPHPTCPRPDDPPDDGVVVPLLFHNYRLKFRVVRQEEPEVLTFLHFLDGAGPFVLLQAHRINSFLRDSNLGGVDEDDGAPADGGLHGGSVFGQLDSSQVVVLAPADFGLVDPDHGSDVVSGYGPGMTGGDGALHQGHGKILVDPQTLRGPGILAHHGDDGL